LSREEIINMASEPDALAMNLQRAISALVDMELQLRAIQSKVSGLGFFARGFVEKDIKGATGRSFGEWIKAAERIRHVLERALKGSKPDAAKALREELPRLAVLRKYLADAPKKLNMVPAAVLKPQQRAEFLRHVSLEGASLQELEITMRDISSALTGVE
jgi:hypothetical protein